MHPTQGWRTHSTQASPFNSLFEMLVTVVVGLHSGQYELSILYLRCGRNQRKHQDAVWGALSILYLRCEKGKTLASVRKAYVKLSILYLRCRVQKTAEETWQIWHLSILYLRCHAGVEHDVKTVAWNFQFSIWDARNYGNHRIELRHVIPFNSLFEMRKRSSERHRGSTQLLSILYLRCAWRVFVDHASWLFTFNSLFEMRRCPVGKVAIGAVGVGAFQFSIWDAVAIASGARVVARKAFQFSIWDANPAQHHDASADQEVQLSILYLRCVSGAVSGTTPALPAGLSILYLRCTGTRVARPGAVLRLFQFSIWDAESGKRVNGQGIQRYFQFSIWDAVPQRLDYVFLEPLKLSILYLRCMLPYWESTVVAFALSFQFSIWDARYSG